MPHLGASCKNLEALQHCSHLTPTTALLHVSARHRRQLVAAALNGQTHPAQHAANTSETPADSSSSESTSSSNRLVKEPVAAVGSVANNRSMHALGAGSSSSKGPLKPPARRGPQGLRDQQRRAAGIPPPQALLTTAPPVLQQPAQTSNGFSNSSSTLYANGFPRTDSSSSSSWQSQRRWLTRQVTDADRCVIRDKGLTAWPGWAELQQAWPQLQQQWDEATQQLPAAIERLLAVSRSGPVKVVVFDIESTACKCCVVSAHLRIRDCRWDCFFKLAQKHLHGWQLLDISSAISFAFALSFTPYTCQITHCQKPWLASS
jgi:hypothetical protein